jgi:hypothetical protein
MSIPRKRTSTSLIAPAFGRTDSRQKTAGMTAGDAGMALKSMTLGSIFIRSYHHDCSSTELGRAVSKTLYYQLNFVFY